MNTKTIVIFSGEGEQGTFKAYAGSRDGLEAYLEQERCGGDRFARAYIHSHDDVYEGLDGDYKTIPAEMIV